MQNLHRRCQISQNRAHCFGIHFGPESNQPEGMTEGDPGGGRICGDFDDDRGDQRKMHRTAFTGEAIESRGRDILRPPVFTLRLLKDVTRYETAVRNRTRRDRQSGIASRVKLERGGRLSQAARKGARRRDQSSNSPASANTIAETSRTRSMIFARTKVLAALPSSL